MRGAGSRHARRAATLLAVLFGVACAFDLGDGGPEPTDAAMLATFTAHRAEFEQLAAMAREDRRFERIAPDFTRPSVPTTADSALTPLRWAQYRALFQRLGARHGVERIEKDADTTLLVEVWGTGMLNSSSSKSYALLSGQPPCVVVPSLDSLHVMPHDSSSPCNIGFRHVDGGWYLRYDW